MPLGFIHGGKELSGSSAGREVGNLLEIEPSRLSGTLRLPPSKSHSMRWLTLASMDKSPTRIEMWEIGEDVQAMIDCLIDLGIKWDGLTMTGGDLNPPNSVLDCQNSGTALRLLIAQAATCDFPITLDGDASLRARSSLHLVKSLEISAKSLSENSEYPLQLTGPFAAKSVSIDVSKTSQFHSAMMLMAPRTNGFKINSHTVLLSARWRCCAKRCWIN